MEDINIAEILKNAIEQNDTNLYKTEHILSGIDTAQALVLADNNKTLKIYTQDNDILNLDLAKSNSSLEKGSGNKYPQIMMKILQHIYLQQTVNLKY